MENKKAVGWLFLLLFLILGANLISVGISTLFGTNSNETLYSVFCILFGIGLVKFSWNYPFKK